jgi:hypothetical protein
MSQEETDERASPAVISKLVWLRKMVLVKE